MANHPTLDTTDSQVDGPLLKRYGTRMKKEAEGLVLAGEKGYLDDRCSINLPLDKEIADQNAALARRHRGADALVVVGIGGSNLGTIAVQEAILGRLHNQTGSGPLVYYADTVDPASMDALLAILRKLLTEGKTVILNGVSKSGGTTETTANFEVLADLHRRYDKNHQDHVVVTTDEGSAFWNLAAKKGYHRLSIPKKVGGRYSVFSAVGQYPLRVMGIDVDSLLKGAAAMRKQCLNTNIASNPAMKRAAMLHHHVGKGKTIADMFLFAPDLESIGKWYRQLMGESIGKEWNAKGTKRVFAGITPTVSIGSTDLHSMAQLYLGGPRDTFTTFVHVHSPQDTSVPKDPSYEPLVPHIQGAKLSTIMDAILDGVRVAYRKGKRPFCTIEVKQLDAFSVGALLQMHMIEMMHLGSLMDVNPFDQPAVEAYKVETKRILAARKR